MLRPPTPEQCAANIQRIKMQPAKGGTYYDYPLGESAASYCPDNREVGGTSRYLCRCAQPEQCEGVLHFARSYVPARELAHPGMTVLDAERILREAALTRGAESLYLRADPGARTFSLCNYTEARGYVPMSGVKSSERPYDVLKSAGLV